MQQNKSIDAQNPRAADTRDHILGSTGQPALQEARATITSRARQSESAHQPGTIVALMATAGHAHLAGAFIALIAAAILIAGASWYAISTEREYAGVLAPVIFEQKTWGNALQQAALSMPDLMMLYGSSELRKGGDNDPGTFFGTYPTGFDVFEVGLHGAGSFTMLQEIAASGQALRGKHVAVIVSPFFFLQPMDPSQWYAFNFSDLNANALAFNTALGLDVRRGAAGRMLQYPSTLLQDPILGFALQRLAAWTPVDQALYYAVLPLGLLHIQVLRLQDHWEVLNYLREQDALNAASVDRKPASMDWEVLIDEAAAAYAPETAGNPFGISGVYWQQNQNLISVHKNDLTDATFRQQLDTSLEWLDLDLLLRSLKELGAKPILMTVPLLGRYYDFRGVSAEARRDFYEKFRAAAKPFDIPAVAFEDHEYDPYFFEDTADHPSSKGWLYYDRVLDDFFHDRFP